MFNLKRKLSRPVYTRKTSAWPGMTFLELVVVLGIFGVIASTVLFNYRDFSENVNLKNLAQNIALQVKRAQTDAVSGKLPILSTNQQGTTPPLIPIGWKPSFGIAFNIEDQGSLDDNKRFFYYFNKGLVDDTSPVYYEDMTDFEDANYISPCGSQPESECLEEIIITGGEMVDLICVNFTQIDIDDSCSGDGTSVDKVYISFTRPRSNANIRVTGTDPTQPNVYIRMASPQGRHKYISIWESGYISIN